VFTVFRHVRSIAERVSCDRPREFGHVERKSAEDSSLRCREIVVVGVRDTARGRKTLWGELGISSD